MFYLFHPKQKEDIFNTFVEGLYSDEESLHKKAISKLIEFSIEKGLQGNLWKNFIIYTLIFNDNPFTRSIERNKTINIIRVVQEDLLEYYRLYTAKMPWMESICSFTYASKKTELVSIIETMVSKITDYKTFEKTILNFYMDKGIGDMALYKAFRVENGELYPIYNVLDVSFDDLIGYDFQKKQLIENTENFINDRFFNNVLLYGDSGTGKSTSIKALLNTYFDQGLRIIEIYKHQMEEISKIISVLKQRPYHYIIYMDDLSFEEDEIEYKYLKSIIEGGIEPKPTNVAIYATSNRRHLIKETINDNEDLHRNETQAEKLSLAYRFGLQIYYSSLSAKEFKTMVLALASKNNIIMAEEELLSEAGKWELTYGSLSGRCATQFIQYISNKISKK